VHHPTYQHLEDRIRLAGLSLLQWAQLCVCALAAFGLSKLLPLPGSWSVSVAVTICGLPAAAAIAFMQADFDVRRWLLDAVAFRRTPRHFAAAPAAAADPQRRQAGPSGDGSGAVIPFPTADSPSPKRWSMALLDAPGRHGER
jgi:hypothetical protein